MGQVIDAGPEIGQVEFPEGMSDAEMGEALSGELERLHNMPSVQVSTPLPGAMDAGRFGGRAVPGEAEQAAVTADPGLQRMEDLTAGAPTRLSAVGEERAARMSILEGQLRQAAGVEDPIRRKAAQDEIEQAMRAEGYTVVKPEPTLTEAATTPLVTMPEVQGSDLEQLGMNPKAAAIAAGLQKGIVHATEFFTSPLGLATMGTAKLPLAQQQAISAGFAVDMAVKAPELFARFGQALGEGDYEKATEYAVAAGANVYFAGKSLEHALAGDRAGQADKLRAAGKEMLEQVQGKEFAPRPIQFGDEPTKFVEGNERIAPVETAEGTPDAIALNQPILQPSAILNTLALEAVGGDQSKIDEGRRFALGASYTDEGIAKSLNVDVRAAELLKQTGILSNDESGNYRLNPEVFAKEVNSYTPKETEAATQSDLVGVPVKQELAAKAARVQKEISEQIAAVQGAARRPEQAAKLGVNVSDPAAILRRVEELKAARASWENWALDPDKVAQLKGNQAAPGPTLRTGENQGDLLMRQSEDFALVGEKATDGDRVAVERAAAEQRAAEARAMEAKQQGSFAGFASRGDYRSDFEAKAAGGGDVFGLGDEELRRFFPRQPDRWSRASGGLADQFESRQTFSFRNYDEFRKWMDERFAEGDLEGMRIAFAEAGSESKVKYIKENRGADEIKKGWISHLATGAPLPAGKPPVTRTTPRPGEARSTARTAPEAARERPPRPGAPPRRTPEDPMSRMGGMDLVRPLEMPELVRIAKQLSGSVPLLRKLPKARGLFDPKTGWITLTRSLFANPKQAAQTLAHEIGHLADYLPDRAMDRGNILGRLAVLKNWLKTTFPAGPRGGAPLTREDRARLRREAEAEAGPAPKDFFARTAWRKEVADIYKQKLTEEIDRRGLAEASEVWREAWELSKWWRPMPARVTPDFMAYRKASAEVYADAISVLLNAPNQLKARAPRFWEMFWNYIGRKPEVLQSLQEVQALLADGPEAVRGKRLEEMRAGFQRGEQAFMADVKQRKARRDSWKGWWMELKTKHLDQAEALTKAVKAVEARTGQKVPEWANPRNAWEENLFHDNRNMLDVERVFREVVKPIEDAGMDQDTLGQVLELQRVIGITVEGPYGEEQVGTRIGLANPGGHNIHTARDTLAELYRQVGPQNAAKLETAALKFRELVFERVTEGTKWGIYSQQVYDEVFVPNKDTYVAFRGLDYVDRYVTPMVRQARGTLGPTENPFLTTMLKLEALNNLIAVQKAKFLTRDFMREHFAESFKPAESYFDARAKRKEFKARPQKASDGSQLERLEMLEDGKRAAYDVDPFIRDAFEKLTPSEISPLLKLLDVPFRNLIYPLIISYNPGFQLLFNPYRDFRRTSRNLGAVAKVGRMELIRNYARSWTEARKFVSGEMTPLAEEMLKAGAIATPMETWGKLNRSDPFMELMERYRLGTEDVRRPIVDKLLYLPRKVQYVGSIFEALPKFASYRALIEHGDPVPRRGLSKGEAAAIVRNYVGTPNFKVKGIYGNVGNVFVPFLNIFMQGYRADFKLMRSPKTAGGWWARWALHDGSKAVLIGLASAGVLGPALKAIFGGISEYDKSNYTTVPIGFQLGGDFGMKTVYLRLPRDETSRVLSAMVYKATRVLAGDKSARKFPWEVIDAGAGVVPTVSPMLQMGDAWRDYLRGQNPIDPWKGRPVVGDTEFKAGGWNSLKPMMVFSLDKLGVVNFVGWDPHAETTTELALSAIPGLKRMVKVSDYGYREQQREAEGEEDRQKALARMDYSDRVRGMLSEYYMLQQVGKNRTAAQESRYGSLQMWHSMFTAMDEVAAVQEKGGDAAVARETRKNFDGLTAEFEKTGKAPAGEWRPLWRPAGPYPRP